MTSPAQHIAVLLGGRSAEREVSLVSGTDCAEALRATGFEVTEIDAGADLAQRLAETKPDAAFIALHGRWGEDGCVQGLLELLDIPYTHSGVLASAMAMNKEVAKTLYRAEGLPVAESRVATPDQVKSRHLLAPPYVVKPVNEGSSVGVLIVPEGANTPPRELPGALSGAAEVMVEAFIPGRELTVSVMGDKALAVTDIIAAKGFYDYDAKYADGGSRHQVPADLPDDITEACLRYAERAHASLGCRGVSRSDFRWNEAKGLDGLILLETNTQPGMTPTSLVPEQAAYCGITYPELVTWMVEDASCSR